MATYTPNFNLKKPEDADFFSRLDQNGNMDILDTTLKTQADKISTVEASLQRQAYDLYTLWLKDYYTNGSAWSPSVLGAKALVFDGFVDTTLINTASSSGFSGTKTYTLPNATDSGNSYPESTVAIAGTQQTGAAVSSGAYQNVVKPAMWSTGVSWNGGGSSNFILFGIRITFAQLMSFSAINMEGQPGEFSRERLRYIYVSYDGTTFTQLFSGTTYMGSRSGAAWTYSYAVSLTNVKAIEVFFDGANVEGTGVFAQKINSIKFAWTSTFTTKFTSKSYTMPTAFKKAKMFLSVNTQTGLTISPYIGGVLATKTNVSSRTDPLNAAYTEYEIDLTVATASTEFYLLLQSIAASIFNSIVISRYAVYFME